MRKAVNEFVTHESHKLKDQLAKQEGQAQDLTEASLGRYNRVMQPFSMRNIRKLPIVGDLGREKEQWPSTESDWRSLWNIRPLPIKLEKIKYSVNEQEKAFTAISLEFQA